MSAHAQPPKQYLYTVGWSEDDEAYVARVAEFPSLAAHGDSQEAALLSLQESVGIRRRFFVVTNSFVLIVREYAPYNKDACLANVETNEFVTTKDYSDRLLQEVVKAVLKDLAASNESIPHPLD